MSDREAKGAVTRSFTIDEIGVGGRLVRIAVRDLGIGMDARVEAALVPQALASGAAVADGAEKAEDGSAEAGNEPERGAAEPARFPAAIRLDKSTGRPDRKIVVVPNSIFAATLQPGVAVILELTVIEGSGAGAIHRSDEFSLGREAFAGSGTRAFRIDQHERMVLEAGNRNLIKRVYFGRRPSDPHIDPIAILGLPSDGACQLSVSDRNAAFEAVNGETDTSPSRIRLTRQAGLYNPGRFSIQMAGQNPIHGRLRVWIIPYTYVVIAILVFFGLGYCLAAAAVPSMYAPDYTVSVVEGETSDPFDPFERSILLKPYEITFDAPPGLVILTTGPAPQPAVGNVRPPFVVQAAIGMAAAGSAPSGPVAYEVPFRVEHLVFSSRADGVIRVQVEPRKILEPRDGLSFPMDPGGSRIIDDLIDVSRIENIDRNDVVVHAASRDAFLAVEQLATDTIRLIAPSATIRSGFEFWLEVPSLNMRSGRAEAQVCVGDPPGCRSELVAVDDSIAAPVSLSGGAIDVLANDRFPSTRPDALEIIRPPRHAAATSDGTTIRLDTVTAVGGEGDNLQYRIAAGGQSASATASFRYAAPELVANDDLGLQVGVNGGVLNVLGNDSGADPARIKTTIVRPPQSAQATVRGDGAILLGPTSAAPGTADSLEYEIQAGSATARARAEWIYTAAPPPPLPPALQAVDDHFDPVSPAGGRFDLVANDLFDRSLPFDVIVASDPAVQVSVDKGQITVPATDLPDGTTRSIQYTLRQQGQDSTASAELVFRDPCAASTHPPGPEGKLVFVPAGRYPIDPAEGLTDLTRSWIRAFQDSGFNLTGPATPDAIVLERGLCIQEREISLAQYGELMEPELLRWARQNGIAVDEPNSAMTHTMAREYAEALAAKTGRPYRLPKAHEWVATLIFAQLNRRQPLLQNLHDDLLEFADESFGLTASEKFAFGSSDGMPFARVAPNASVRKGGARALYVLP